MKQKTDEGRNVVSCRITYTCGRCANTQVRRFKAEGGLLTVPQVYCGQCAKMNALVTMSSVVSEVRCEEANVEAKTAGLVGRAEVSEAGSAAGAIEQPAQRRIVADAPPDKDAGAGTGRAESVPALAKAAPRKS